MSGDELSLPVIHFTEERIPDGEPGCRVITWQQYHLARNAVLKVSRQHSTVGPMGEAPIVPGKDMPREGWIVENDSPDYYVTDDQYNDHERYIYMEPRPQRVTAA